MISAPRHPAGERDGLSGVLSTQRAGLVSAKHERSFVVRRTREDAQVKDWSRYTSAPRRGSTDQGRRQVPSAHLHNPKAAFSPGSVDAAPKGAVPRMSLYIRASP